MVCVVVVSCVSCCELRVAAKNLIVSCESNKQIKTIFQCYKSPGSGGFIYNQDKEKSEKRDKNSMQEISVYYNIIYTGIPGILYYIYVHM
jgi:hypothetical protein